MSVAREQPVVLVVDDDVGIREALAMLLGDAFFVVTAPDGGEALGIVGLGLNPDVILSDLMMPEVDGLELHEQLPARFQPRFVLMTASPLHGAIGARIESAGVPVLRKARDLMRVEEVLLSVIEATQAARRVA